MIFMTSRYPAALRSTGLFTEPEIAAMLKEYFIHRNKDDGIMHAIHPQTRQELVAPLLMEKIKGTDYYSCLSGDEAKAYESATDKIKENIKDVWFNITKDPEILHSMSVVDRAVLHSLYNIPMNHLEIIEKGVEQYDALITPPTLNT